jgi:cholesterol oxidase
MNYLPDAANYGAEIFTEVAVRYLKRTDSGWQVYFQPLGVGRATFHAPDPFVAADIVILGAGALGSTEILLRSARQGLPLSPMLGKGFTGNGDVLGFGYNTDQEINGIGFGDHHPAGREKVGPCITSIIDMRHQPVLDEGMVIEEGSIPGAVAALLPAGLEAAAALCGNHPRDFYEAICMKKRELETLTSGGQAGALHNTQTYLIMARDNGQGSMYLENDRLRISWPGAGSEPIFAEANENLKKATEPLGGVYAPNPAWHSLQKKSLVSVHPLGGCVMGEDATAGVVNHKGQVFAGADGKEVYAGLYVDDGGGCPGRWG